MSRRVAKLPAPRPGQDGQGIRLALITASFNAEVTDAMREDALRTARDLGATIAVDVRSPGTFDIPLLLARALERADVDAAVVLGAVVKGETRHDEVVAFEAARRVAELALRFDKPVGMGITGPGQTLAQARARIDRAGWAVRAACQQFKTLRELSRRDARAR